MKYSTLLIVITLSILITGTFWWWTTRSYPVKNLPTKPVKELVVIAVGDSLVEGYGSTEGHDFVSLVSQKLGVPILNYGVSGNTSAQVLARIGEVVAEKPDITILLVGGNDALQKIPKEQTFSNIAKTIETLQASGSAVVLIGVQGGLVGDAYQSKFESLAKEYQTIYIGDILDGLIGDTRYMSDYVHPNNAGYEKVAERVSNGIEKALNKE